MSNTEQEIAEMARLTVLSNNINPIQEKNMKMFPFVHFDGVKSVKIDYDLAKNKYAGDGPEASNSRISYYLTIDESQKNDYMDNRLKSLEQACRNLFWKEVCLEVYFNDRIVYKSVK